MDLFWDSMRSTIASGITGLLIGFIFPFKKSIGWRVASALFFAAIIWVGAALGSAAWKIYKTPSIDSYIADSLAEIEKEPLIGAIIRESPGARSIFSNALKATRGHDREAVFNAMVKAGTEARLKYAAPALRNAPDEAINAVWDAQLALLVHLRETNITLCGVFAFQALDLRQLDAKGIELFRASARAQEVAISAGNLNQVSPPKSSEAETATLLAALSLSESDARALQQLQNAPRPDACEAVHALYLANRDRPAREKAILARTIISDGY
jgi:hypothetical protein